MLHYATIPGLIGTRECKSIVCHLVARYVLQFLSLNYDMMIIYLALRKNYKLVYTPNPIQPQIKLDRCFSSLDQDVLRIRSAIDACVFRRRELSRILASSFLVRMRDLKSGLMSNDELSFSAFLASDDSPAYSAISELPPSVADSALVVLDFLIPEVVPSSSIVTDLFRFFVCRFFGG